MKTKEQKITEMLKSIPDSELRREMAQWSTILYFIRDNPWITDWVFHNGFSRVITYGTYTHNPNEAIFKEGVRYGYFTIEQFFNKKNIADIIDRITNELDSRNKKKAKKKTKKKTKTNKN